MLARIKDQDTKGPAAGMLRQLKLRMMRSTHEVFRAKGTIIIKIVQQVAVSIVCVGTCKLGTNLAPIMDRFGLLSLVFIGTTSVGIAGSIRAFPKEKDIVSDELALDLHTTLPYFVSKATSEVPLTSFFSSMSATILHPLVGLQKG